VSNPNRAQDELPSTEAGVIYWRRMKIARCGDGKYFIMTCFLKALTAKDAKVSPRSQRYYMVGQIMIAKLQDGKITRFMIDLKK